MKKTFIFTFVLSLICVFSVFAQLPDEYYQFRDNMYNFEKSPDEMEKTGRELLSKADKELSGYEMYLAKARYEYILGRVWFYQNQPDKAAAHYDKGVEYAEKAMDIRDDTQARLIYAENISANCAVKPVSYAVLWGRKVPGLTKKVIKLDPKNGAAHYMQHAQDIYAPFPFNNHKKGIEEMKGLLNNSDVVLEKDDEFNVLSAIGYGYMQLENYKEAVKWLEDSLKVYPGNQYVQSLIAECKTH